MLAIIAQAYAGSMTAVDLSILLPVRNGERFLGEALRSLSAQTFEAWEAIVVDDGSSDCSVAIAAKHAAGDSRFRLVPRCGEGLVAALETARVAARGRLIARMDADDVALPDRLAVQLAALAEDALDAVGGGVEYFPAEDVTDGARRYTAWLNSLVTVDAAARDVFVECPLAHPTLMARAETLGAVGGYRDCGWPENYDLVLRLWATGARFRNVDRVLLRWRDHPGRLSRTESTYAVDAFVRCKAHHLDRTLLAPFPSVCVWGAGPVGKAFARELARIGRVVDAFVEVHPRKIGRRIYRAPVVAVEDAPRFAASFAIGAVAGLEARERIRAVVREQGRREGVDFVAVA